MVAVVTPLWVDAGEADQLRNARNLLAGTTNAREAGVCVKFRGM